MRKLGACFGLAVLLCSREAMACAPAPSAGERIAILEESAVIVWEPQTRTEHFIRRATFRGEAKHFGFLVPTPTAPQLQAVDDDIFDRLKTKTSQQIEYKTEKRIDWTPIFAMWFVRKSKGVATTAAPPVEVLATEKVGGYEAAILSATDAAALQQWLADNRYDTTPELTEWLDAYVKQHWIISAFKIDRSNDFEARTQTVRMSFTTDRPFFPYREPASQREGTLDTRLLRVFFVGPERVTGTIGADGKWPAELEWSDAIRDAEVAGVPVSPNARLTAFEDTSNPRPGTDDLFFTHDADQKTVVPPPYVVTNYDTTYVPADLIGLPLLVIGFFVWRWRRRRQMNAAAR